MEAKIVVGVGMTAAAFTVSCIGTWREPAPRTKTNAAMDAKRMAGDAGAAGVAADIACSKTCAADVPGSVDAAAGVGARIPTKASASCAGLDAGYNNGSFGVAFSPLRESPAPGATTVDSSVRTVDLYESDAEELQHRSPAALLPAGSPMNDSVATAGLKSDFLAGIQDEDEEPAALKQSATPQWKIMNPEDQGAWPASNGWGTPQEQREAEQRRRHEVMRAAEQRTRAALEAAAKKKAEFDSKLGALLSAAREQSKQKSTGHATDSIADTETPFRELPELPSEDEDEDDEDYEPSAAELAAVSPAPAAEQGNTRPPTNKKKKRKKERKALQQRGANVPGAGGVTVTIADGTKIQAGKGKRRGQRSVA